LGDDHRDVKRAVFLDRDGTLNELLADPVSGLPESPLSVDDVRLIPGAALGARALIDAGFVLIGVTNQPAAAKGKATQAQLLAVQERVVQLLAMEHISFAAFEICWHHPAGTVTQD
jgi:D-glycero-D-manno-heptose 1,7-bisphosphate phosphatase